MTVRGVEHEGLIRVREDSWKLCKGSRLRLVFGPANSMHGEKNYHTGGVVAAESGENAKTVRVKLHHDTRYPSSLVVPIAAKSSVAGG